jgi:hypothetical protein
VLSQLSALTAPTSLSPVLADLPPPSSTLPADRNGYTPHGPATAQGASQDGAPYQHQPQQDVHAARSTRGSSSSSHTSTGGAARVYLPALASLWCHPPTWRLTDGSDLVVQPQTVVLHPAPPPPAVSGGGATSPGAGNSGVLSAANTAGALQQGTAVVAGHVQGRGVQGGDSAREGADAGGIVPQEPSTLQGPGVPALLGSPGKGAARRRLLLPCIVTPSKCDCPLVYGLSKESCASVLVHVELCPNPSGLGHNNGTANVDRNSGTCVSSYLSYYLAKWSPCTYLCHTSVI